MARTEPSIVRIRDLSRPQRAWFVVVGLVAVGSGVIPLVSLHRDGWTQVSDEA